MEVAVVSTSEKQPPPTDHNHAPLRSRRASSRSSASSPSPAAPSSTINNSRGKKKRQVDPEIENIQSEMEPQQVRFDLGESQSDSTTTSSSSAASTSSAPAKKTNDMNKTNRHLLKTLNTNPSTHVDNQAPTIKMPSLKNIDEEKEDVLVNVDEDTVDCFSLPAMSHREASLAEQDSNLLDSLADDESMSQNPAPSADPALKKERKRKRRSSIILHNNLTSLHITAPAQLFIYNWPVADDDDESVVDVEQKEKDRLNKAFTSNHNELFCLQEQISEFLGVKSFKRKYPDIFRRFIDIKEREYLKEHKVVSETQCDLGLTALNLADCLDLMADEYPDKYREMSAFLEERRRRALTENTIRETKRLAMTIQAQKEENKANASARPAQERDRMKELIQKTMKSAAMYNSQLQRDIREERRQYFDLQTMRLHCKTKPMKYEPAAKSNLRYPVALLAGQFQYHYEKFTSEEKLYQPLNTIMCTRPVPTELLYAEWKKKQQGESNPDERHKPHLLATPASSPALLNSTPGSRPIRPREKSFKYQSSDDEEASNDSKSKFHALKPRNQNSQPNSTIRITASAAPTIAKLISSAHKLCYVCQKGSSLFGTGSTSASIDPNQLLIQCSSCPRASHPNCLELNPQLVDWECIRAYDWQCLECKRCSRCQKTQDEDKMMFCDRCDRGFHTYCVGLAEVPSGSWLCTECSGWQEKLRGLSEKFNEKKLSFDSPVKPALPITVISPSSLSPAVQLQLKSKLTTSSGRSSVKRLSTSQLLEDGVVKRGRGRPKGSLNKSKDGSSPKKTPKSKETPSPRKLSYDYSNSNGGPPQNGVGDEDSYQEYSNSGSYTHQVNGGLHMTASPGFRYG